MNTYAKTLLAAAAVLAGIVVAQDAHAVPPVVRGIDLPTVLGFYDRARRADHRIEAKHAARPARFRQLKTIVLDPGHGGRNQGALGVAHTHEKFLTLELAYTLRDRIQRKYPHVRVVLTRYWDADVGLTERIEFANQIDADLFVSLHYNAAVHPRAVGYETYFLDAAEATPGKAQVEGEPVATASLEITGIDAGVEDAPEQGAHNLTIVEIERDLLRQRQHRDSALLARTVQAQLRRRLDSTDRGVKQANFAVLRGALMPAVVVEAGFLTHPREGSKVVEDHHRGRVVAALVRAIENFDRRLASRREK